MDEEEDVEESDEDAEDDEEIDEEGFSSTAPPLSEAGLTETTESATGTDTGTETPDIVQIKKFGARDDQKQLYQTLDVQKNAVGTNLMGSAYTYAVPRGSDVEVSLNPGELEQYQDPELAQEKYAQALEDAQAKNREDREGVDDVYDEQTRKRAKKDNKGKTNKPHKAFKF